MKDHWVPTITQEAIYSSGANFSLLNLIGDPVKVQDWNLCGLPFDNTSAENIVIMQFNKSVPLVIDPQKQFLKFIKNFERRSC